MVKPNKPLVILMAEDDHDYYLLTKDAIEKLAMGIDLRYVEDGEELMQYLLRQAKYEDPESSPRPDIIFLDLNMPRKNGIEALREIKSNHALRQIPVIILTISQDAMDVSMCYRLGANSFITKPLGFEQLLDVIKVLSSYWFKTVLLPSPPNH
ncbi:MAG: response regulator [Candidatus Omnitrophica bacterium]|nr:response regulator [Candidatus Omnitrophota bacterium]MDD5672444.1 response regulator [Candidatus Omnitrophota bacterium]